MPRKASRILPISEETYALPSIGTNNLDGNDEKTSELSGDWNQLLSRAKLTSKWIHLSSVRRGLSSQKVPRARASFTVGNIKEQFYDNLNSALNGLASECDYSSCDEDTGEKHQYTSYRDLPKSSNKALIIYFSKLAQSTNGDDELDLDFINTLIDNGADVNTTDKYGQSVFHEVARTWHTDVGKFLLSLNANINQCDKYGRTPLHVAAAVNYPEMVKFLIENGANADAKTLKEGQTPVHYAAKNDALDSLKMLCKLECDVEAKDNKERTPLHVAAELDRSETALFLVEEGVRVGNCDNSGLSTLTLMIDKMPPVAFQSLDQYHRTDRPNRKQYFYLNLLEPIQPGKFYTFTRTPMQSVTINKQMNLLLHPVFRELIKVKWKQFARLEHLKQMFIQFIFVILWSAIGLTTPLDATSEYTKKPIVSIWYRAVLEGLGVLFSLIFIYQELREWRSSAKDHLRWQTWRRMELETDLNFCHPRWPEERKYIIQELEAVKEEKISYFSDLWNILDWITYFGITAGVLARIAAICGDVTANKAHKRILSISIIIIWIRLMKFARPFTTLGPFIVMLGNILAASLKFCFLYFGLIIPYIIALWINFGGVDNAKIMTRKGQSSDGWKEPNDLMYSTWLMTVVGDFDFGALLAVDPIFAQALVGTFTAISGILLLNLFIALLSDTFQRVHDNVAANALMQRAIAINSYQSGLSARSRDRFIMYIQGQCAPEKVYYDDDDNEEGGELEKMTIQIKEVCDEIKESLETEFECNKNGFALDSLRDEIKDVVDKHKEEMDSINKKLDNLTYLVQHLIEKDKPESTASTEETKSTKLDYLPSIYQLKPQLYSPSMTLEEKLNKSLKSSRRHHGGTPTE